MASPDLAVTGNQKSQSPQPPKDRPCDTCRRRKSRCVVPENSVRCILCEFHKQNCTFAQRPQPRKRKSNAQPKEEAERKRKSLPQSLDHEVLPQDDQNEDLAVKDYAKLRGPSLLKKTLGLQNHRHARYIGPSSDLEPLIINNASFDRKGEYALASGILRSVSDDETFLMQDDRETQKYVEESSDLDLIEGIVAPHGFALIKLYFRIMHPNFPILHKKVFLEKYKRSHREFSPPLLAAVYILALNWWSFSVDLCHLAKPDSHELERLAFKTIGDVVCRPKISTVQAGLLLLQRPTGDPWGLTARMVAVGHQLGLHLDCSSWKIPHWERGVRKRVAWALFMQEKWASLVYGRPPLISGSNWAVRDVTNDDFPETATDDDEEEGSSEVEKGRALFTEMISLTEILAEILKRFFSLKALSALKQGEGHPMRKVLEKVKPIQLRLKVWFANLPSCLQMESKKIRKLSSNGYLHLAYFTVEITLHRAIVRSLHTSTTDSSLVEVCRSAAKARLIAAMEFVDSLKPELLQSFWYFASRANFTIIGAFAGLLCATASNEEEADFYRGKLKEYHWMLKVSSRGTDFMESAVTALDVTLKLLDNFDASGKLADVDRQGEAADELWLHEPIAQPDLSPSSRDSYLQDPEGCAAGADHMDGITASIFDNEDVHIEALSFFAADAASSMQPAFGSPNDEHISSGRSYELGADMASCTVSIAAESGIIRDPHTYEGYL
ncbi:MAG: Fungal specific transcription factor [Piccolia ochrophora]|nr:MAG: Fungal specific transcription factor [Piccolia ochrophora]